MRIAMMTNNFKPVVGGVPVAIERLAEGLRERGHEVYIFAPEYEGYQKEEEFVIRYKAFHKKAGGYVPVMKPIDLHMEKTFREMHFDIIHVHHPVLIGQRAQYLGKKYNVPVVFTYHTRYEQYLHYWKPYKWLKEQDGNLEGKAVTFIENQMVLAFIKKFTEKCSLVFAPTDQIQTIIEEREWKAPITVMPTGLTEQAYLGKEESQGIRQQYGNGKQYLLCTVSRLSAEKNIKFMLDSLKELKKRIGDEFQMLMIGDGPQKEELVAYTRSLNLENNVTFLGIVPNETIPAYHRACDAFLFSSKSETQGIVLLEAMAGASPVIAVKATGVCDVVRNGENGFMTGESIEEFAELTARVLENQELQEALSEGAQETAARFRNSVVAQMAESNYNHVLRAKKDYKKELILRA